MLAQFRQEKILKTLENKGVVYLRELASEMGISESTVRRDIMKLEQENSVEALRGGAIRLKRRKVDLPVVESSKTRMDEKQVIARKAASLVQDGDIIYIDAGTTTSAMIKYLANKRITVVTSSMEVLQQLPVPGVSVVSIGGEVNMELESICGPIAEKNLSMLYFDKAFFSISAYSDMGIFVNDIREARKKEIVKEHSFVTYILADSSKQNQWGFIRFMDSDEGILISEKDDPKDDRKEEQSEQPGQNNGESSGGQKQNDRME